MPEATEEDTAPVTRTTSWYLAWLCGWPLVIGGTAAYLVVYRNHLPNIYGACAAALAEIGVALLALLLPSSGHTDYGGRLRSHWPTGFLGGAAVLAGVAFAAGQIIPPAGDKTEKTGAVCARPANAVRAPLVTSPYPGLAFKEMTYDLSYGKEGGAPWAYLELAGKISGGTPPRTRLYLVGWADPSTVDSGGNPGNGRYAWRPDREIYRDDAGCWSLPRFKLGYAGAQGVTFRYYPTVIPDTERPCLEALARADRNNDGLTLEQLTSCDSTFLGYSTIPTKRL